MMSVMRPLTMKNSGLIGWVNLDTVQKTMEQSTQWGVSLPNTFPMKRHFKSRNPALNIPRRHEAVATDTVFSDTPAVDSGIKQAQVFVGRDTLVADAYPMKSGKQFVNILEDNIRRRGAMDKLLSDSAKTEISNKVMDILRAYHISNWHSEPITRIKILLNGGTGLSNPGPIQSRIGLVPQPTAGSYASSMCVIYSTT